MGCWLPYLKGQGKAIIPYLGKGGVKVVYIGADLGCDRSRLGGCSVCGVAEYFVGLDFDGCGNLVGCWVEV